MHFDEDGTTIIPEEGPMVHTVSCDKKPGSQILQLQKRTFVLRKKPAAYIATMSTIVSEPFHFLQGSICSQVRLYSMVSENHKSSDFISLLKKFDRIYPKEDIIRIICDNHSVHKSREIQKHLATRSECRFVFMFTPKHGSWLNLIESFFRKMTKQMLKGIRVKSKEELAERIYRYFVEINADPVVYHWTYKLVEISEDESKVHAAR